MGEGSLKTAPLIFLTIISLSINLLNLNSVNRCLWVGCDYGAEGRKGGIGSYLTQSVYQVVLQKSIPTKIRPLILYINNSKGYVDGFVGKLTSAKRL